VAVSLVELDAAGRFTRLERGTSDGMLTLHPERDGRSAHGNIVRSGGVEPLAVDWWADASIGFEGDGFGCAVAGWSGSGWIVAADLSLRPADADTRPGGPRLSLDERGVPVLLHASEWALEV